jgi:hypothetical protein
MPTSETGRRWVRGWQSMPATLAPLVSLLAEVLHVHHRPGARSYLRIAHR